MLKKLSLMAAVFLIVAAQAVAQEGTGPGLGANLMSLGFYAGAEDAFRQDLASNPTRENVKGLIQTLLAQGKPVMALETLASPVGTKLSQGEIELYRSLAAFQEGTLLPGIKIKVEDLDQNEHDWLLYVEGLMAFSRKDFSLAEKAWKRLDSRGQGALWAFALSQEIDGTPLHSSQDSGMNSALEKRLERLRTQDWPILQNYLLGMIARGHGDKAREFIEKNSSRLPKAESELITALSYGQKTPERASSLMKALPDFSDPRLLAIAVGLCENETVINMNDVEDQLKSRKNDPFVAMILSLGWIQKNAPDHAYELLSAAPPDSLPQEWQLSYYSTLSNLAGKLNPPRYREAANALIKWRGLASTTAAQAALLQRQIGDDLFKNGDFTDAATVYEKYPSSDEQAVLAWLKADKPDEAKRVLLRSGGDGFPQALLGYLMYVRDHDGSVENVYKPFLKHDLPMEERWPIEFLRVDSLFNSKPEAALEKLMALDIPANASYKAYFDLEEYQLLSNLGRSDEAKRMLDGILARRTIPREFALLGLEQALLEQRPESPMEILPRAGVLPDAERVSLMLLVAECLGNTPDTLAKVQKAIDGLPPADRVSRMIILAKRWALIGRPDKARTIIDALKESPIEGAERNEVDFLRATIDAMTGDPAAESEFAALSERPETDVRLRGLIRLADYEAEHGKPQLAKEIFYKKLSPLTGRPFTKDLIPIKEEALKSFVAISRVLSEKDGARLKEWVEEQSKSNS